MWSYDWLLASPQCPHPPLLSVSSTGHTREDREDRERETTCWWDRSVWRGWGRSQIIRPQNSLVLYNYSILSEKKHWKRPAFVVSSLELHPYHPPPLFLLSVHRQWLQSVSCMESGGRAKSEVTSIGFFQYTFFAKPHLKWLFLDILISKETCGKYLSSKIHTTNECTDFVKLFSTLQTIVTDLESWLTSDTTEDQVRTNRMLESFLAVSLFAVQGQCLKISWKKGSYFCR